MKTQLTTSKTLIAAAVLAANFNLQAQQADELETITVTATRTEQGLDNTLASVVVIDRAEIESIQAVSTLELLSNVAGLDISQQGGRGQSSSVFVRGTSSDHALVLVDGIRISSATLGSSDLQSIAPAQIERIEIVKGPRAAIWGSDAIGGVIQIFTRKSSGLSAEVNIGSESYKQASATVGFTHGDGSSSITVSHEQADGFDVFVGGDDDKDGFEYKSFTATGEQNVSEQLQLTYLLQSNKSDNEYDNTFGAGNDQVESDNYVWFVGANYQWSEQDTLSVKFGQNRDSSLNYQEDVNTDSLFETKRNQLFVQNTTTLDNATFVTYGVDLIEESIETTGTEYPVTERNLIGAYVYGQKQVEQFTIEGAVRYDDIEDVDSEATYNLGLGYDLTDSTTLAINHSTGFKAPTFNDLYSPYGGNPELKSETSESTELLLKQDLENGALGISLYQTEVENLIDWRQLSNGSYAPLNVDAADITGGEIELTYTHGMLTHNINVSYIDTEDKNTGKQLVRRARENFSYKVNAQLGEIGFSVSYLYKGKRPEKGAYNAELGAREDIYLDSYSLVNAALSYSVTEQIDLNFKVNNLFDEDYTTAYNYNNQGQIFYFGVSYQQ